MKLLRGATRNNPKGKIGFDGKPFKKVQPLPKGHDTYSVCGTPKIYLGDNGYMSVKLRGCE
jgi:hypothetical protein